MAWRGTDRYQHRFDFAQVPGIHGGYLLGHEIQAHRRIGGPWCQSLRISSGEVGGRYGAGHHHPGIGFFLGLQPDPGDYYVFWVSADLALGMNRTGNVAERISSGFDEGPGLYFPCINRVGAAGSLECRGRNKLGLPRPLFPWVSLFPCSFWVFVLVSYSFHVFVSVYVFVCP